MNPLAFIGTGRQLASQGVLGINQRNAHYISVYNKRRYYPLVDDKARTKIIATEHGVAVPDLYHMVQTPSQLRSLHGALAPFDQFVVKPACGSGGEGVVVVIGRTDGGYRCIDGTILSKEDMEHHVSKILGGLFSLGGQPDKALFEYRVQFDPLFEDISYLGVPDIRIIVFLGVPVMAMVRLPTRASHGKANLHQGAVGAGIRIDNGRTCAAVWKNRTITTHPDTGAEVVGRTIPQWRSLLSLASTLGTMTGLGYVGADIVLDASRGPLLLELNARPGLSIQIANQRGLLPRLRVVEEHVQVVGGQDFDGVAFAEQMFKGLS